MATPVVQLPPPPVECTHSGTEYFFVDPFCKEHGLLVKITVLVFHVLTLGVPFGMYHVVVWLVPSWKYEQPFMAPPDLLPRTGTLQQAALTFADSLLITENTPFDPHLEQERINPHIAQLETLFREELDIFYKTVSAHQNDPWEQEDVMYQAGVLMKIAFAVTYRAIQEIPKMQEALKEQGVEKTPAQILATLKTEKPSFENCLMHCGVTYYMLRLRAKWDKESDKVTPSSLERDAVVKFYQLSTPQCDWRTLYNSILSEFDEIGITEEDLAQVRPLLLEWIDPDRGEKYFTPGRSAREPEKEPEEPKAVS